MRFAVVALLLCACGKKEPPRPTAAATEVDIRTGEFALSKEAQNRIWEVENRYFPLQAELAPVLGRAMRAGTAGPWRQVCRADFEAVHFSENGIAARHGPLRIVRWGKAESRRKVGVDGWHALLATLRAPFGDGLEEASVHFDDLEPVEGLNGPWKGSWTIRIAGRLRSGLRAEVESVSDVSYGNLPDEPLQESGWIASLRERTRVMRVVRAPLFEEVTAKCGIDTSKLLDNWTWKGKPDQVTSIGTYLLDYDNDGTLDLLVLDMTPHLYRGNGDGTFAETTKAAGLPVLAHYPTATVGDFDDDGDDDLLMDRAERGQWFREVWRNDGNKFEKMAESDLDIPQVVVGNGAVADFDNDGLLDLYLPNSGPRPGKDELKERWIGDWSGSSGILLKNMGGWKFSDVTKKLGAGGGHREIFSAAWLDVEPDGDPDLFLGHHFGENLMLFNHGAREFATEVMSKGFGGFTMGVATGDLDGDGDEDLYLANMSSRAGRRIFGNLDKKDFPGDAFKLIQGFVAGNQVLLNDEGGFDEHFEHTAGWTYGPTVADFDGDGRLDIYSPAGFQSVKRGQPDG